VTFPLFVCDWHSFPTPFSLIKVLEFSDVCVKRQKYMAQIFTSVFESKISYWSITILLTCLRVFLKECDATNMVADERSMPESRSKMCPPENRNTVVFSMNIVQLTSSISAAKYFPSSTWKEANLIYMITHHFRTNSRVPGNIPLKFGCFIVHWNVKTSERTDFRQKFWSSNETDSEVQHGRQRIAIGVVTCSSDHNFP